MPDNQILLGGFLNFGLMGDFYNGVVNGATPTGDFYQQNFTNNPSVPLATNALHPSVVPNTLRAGRATGHLFVQVCASKTSLGFHIARFL